MKVEVLESTKKIPRFFEVEQGKCFFYTGRVYMKCLPQSGDASAVDLETGLVRHFNLEDGVRLVEAAVTVRLLE